MRIEGRFFEKGQAASTPASLVTVDSAVKIILASEEEGGSEQRPAALRSVSARIGEIPRKITFIDGAVFETTDNEAVDAMLVETGFARPSRIHFYERFHPRLILVMAAVVALLYGAISHGLPVAAYIAVKLTPDPIIELIDDGVVATVDNTMFSASRLPTERQNDLTEKFHDMIRRSDALDEPPDLLFRRGGAVGANAFALPGGTVVVTDELVALADKDDQILGVLAHELGHVIHFHSLQQIYRALGISFLIAATIGDPGPIIEDVVAHGALLLSLSYSRQFERDADAEGVRIMEAAGLDSLALGTMLQKLVEACKGCEGSSWYSTHPAISERLETLQK